MSKALYRKYRSMSLDEVVGQEHVTKTLEGAVAGGKVNHAYLFTGPKGVGKTSVARILAYKINGIPYSGESSHLDIIEIDAASNRRIDDIRDLREKVHITPVDAKYKVYIIDEVHMLTGESFNALLKTLEEPPAHVVFILATTEFHKLPATIVSRTQRFHFKPIEQNKVIAHLRSIAKKEKIPADDDALRLIAEHGEGSFRDSISLLDQLATMNGDRVALKDVEDALGLAPAGSIEKIIKLLGSRDSAKLQEILNKLENQGANPVSLAVQLEKALLGKASQNPGFYDLIEDLLEVSKSSKPGLKLALTLLQFQNRGQQNTVQPAPKQAAAADTKDPSISRKPSEVKIGSKLLTPDNWNEILAECKKSSPALFSVLKNTEPRFLGDSIELATSYKIYQKKLDDTRYKNKLVETVKNLGFDCPPVVTVYDKDAVPPEFSKNAGEVDESTSSVLAMMGGGEVVDA